MIRQIISGYLGILRTIFRIVILLAICVGAGFLIVWPLWRLADSDPALYTVIFGIVAGTIVLFLAFSACRKAWKRDSRKFLFRLASFLVLAGGFAAAVALVLSWQRLAALIAVLATLALYGFIAFGLFPDRRARKS